MKTVISSLKQIMLQFFKKQKTKLHPISKLHSKPHSKLHYKSGTALPSCNPCYFSLKIKCGCCSLTFTIPYWHAYSSLFQSSGLWEVLILWEFPLKTEKIETWNSGKTKEYCCSLDFSMLWTSPSKLLKVSGVKN